MVDVMALTELLLSKLYKIFVLSSVCVSVCFLAYFVRAYFIIGKWAAD